MFPAIRVRASGSTPRSAPGVNPVHFHWRHSKRFFRPADLPPPRRVLIARDDLRCGTVPCLKFVAALLPKVLPVREEGADANELGRRAVAGNLWLTPSERPTIYRRIMIGQYVVAALQMLKMLHRYNVGCFKL